jgi:hypothetical protein
MNLREINMGKINMIMSIIAILIALTTLFIGPKVYNLVWGKVGIKVTPEEILYKCGQGITRTISVKNYEDTVKENFALTISWPQDKELALKLEDLNKIEVIRGAIKSMDLEGDGMHDRVYIIPSINANEALQFDLKLLSECNESFSVYINKYEPIKIKERIHNFQ